MSAAANLGAILSADEAAWIAADLRQTGLAHRAARRAYSAHQTAVKGLLADLIAEQGGASRACAVLEGIAAVPRVSRPDVVWTAPSGSGIEGRTTLAAAELVNEATTTVYAATYSAGWGSRYVKTLRLAAERGVAVTLVVDRGMQDSKGQQVRTTLPDARIWAYAAPNESGGALQHAKLVVVDDSAALVTSANFSQAAAKHHLECGLLTRDPVVVRGIRSQLDTLRKNGVLVDY